MNQPLEFSINYELTNEFLNELSSRESARIIK